MSGGTLGWSGIARLGLVQAAIGAIVVLTTSTLNRVMVVELGLAASVPGALVAFHYGLQMLRPRWGHGADRLGRRAPWIIGGMALLAIGGALAAVATALMAWAMLPGVMLAIAAFALIGVGVGASGTALLTLLADGVDEDRRPAAASLVWIMMIIGFIAATIVASRVLTPFSFHRLELLSAGVSLAAFAITCVAVRGLEDGIDCIAAPERRAFGEAVRAVWADAPARRFAIFIFVSMLAYSAQDLILEPFAGIVFTLPPAATTAITSLQNGGVLVGMLAVATLGRWLGGGGVAAMRRMTLIGCLLSALSLVAIAIAGGWRIGALLHPAVAALGFSNGMFAVSAIGLMMSLAGERDGAGVRMGVWGAAQAIAFGGGGFAGTVAVDLARIATGDTIAAYAGVFFIEAVLFVGAAGMLYGQGRSSIGRDDPALVPAE